MKRDRKEYPLVEATVDEILKPGQKIRTVWHNGKIYIHAVDLARAAGAEHDYEMLRGIKPEDTECRAKFQLTYDSLTEEEKQRTRNRSVSFLTTKGINRRIQGTNLDNHQRDTLAKIAETAESIEEIKHQIQREALVQQTINIPAVTPEELTAENKQLAAVTPEELTAENKQLAAVTPEELTAENKQLAAELDALASDLWKRRRAPHIAQLSEQLQKHLLFAASKIAELAMMIEKEAGTHEK